MAKKGRIPESQLDVLNGLADGIVKQGKYSRERKGTRTTHIWDRAEEKQIVIYDTKITKNGPISIEYIPKTEAKEVVESVKNNDLLPKTQRTYINPANGKEVGYARAKTLGLI